MVTFTQLGPSEDRWSQVGRCKQGIQVAPEVADKAPVALCQATPVAPEVAEEDSGIRVVQVGEAHGEGVAASGMRQGPHRLSGKHRCWQDQDGGDLVRTRLSSIALA
jgi:hypothetical protein